ncbi:SDR family NAD(P)-dependent oxidoreductase [Parvularcula dongshanensis]|uniref:NAD(P)-dependent dehydrogenase (Short-subunit alcohol dehydrogenase family) n=1 Tax=Parvularcula dongshanensis TaxID=1173995 RepID=A0A840I5E1_9PROT|nr:SDR family oxidoreductase [Parvularcula dongshanensis]MBB4659414.1 NAD(P)-dependent dehydrogenase (short-subunit alcohol dehydrogenase family) [Parvularcula dongshanensis]
MAGRSVIVTGAGGGIGRATALRFARSGDRLVLADTDATSGIALRDEIRAGGGEASFIEAELYKKLDVHNVIADALDAYGSVNVLAHCDNLFFSAPFLETSEEDLDLVLDRNVRACFLLNRAVAKQIIKQASAPSDGGVDTARSGAIVNVVSNEAVTASADHAIFAASQGAVVQLTKAVAMTLSPYGARANAVGAAAIKEELDDVESTTTADRKRIIAATPLARRGEPEEAASAVHFLASEDASFITGQTLFVDGGRLALHTVPDKEGAFRT